MIVVSGATNGIGRELIAMLSQAGLAYKVLSRDRKETRRIFGQDVACVTGDMDRPATLKAAFGGVSRLFLCAQASPHLESRLCDAIAVARTCGINHVVLVSGPDILMPLEVKSEFGTACWRAEEALIQSGLDFTILRPNFLMQNLLHEQAELVQTRGIMRGIILPEAPVCMVDARDVAGVAYAALCFSGHKGQTYSLFGPPTSFNHICQSLSLLLEEDIFYEQVRGRAAKNATARRTTGKWHAQRDQDWAKVLAAGGGDFFVDTIEHITGYKPRTVEEFLADHLNHFK